MIHSKRSKDFSRAGILFLAFGAILVAGCNGGPEAHWDLPDDYGSRIDPEGHIVILVIDRSLSMTQKDPNNFNIAGAQIALSVMDDEDNAAVVTFAGEGELVQTTRALESSQGRSEFRDKLESINITGRRTDFSKGLGAAKALLEPLKGRGKAVSIVFLTDGEHSVRETADRIPPLIDEFEKNNWKIFAIDLAARTAKTELLRDMASQTRGAYFKIENPEDLPKAFIEIFSDIKDFWRYGSPGDVRVQPLMKKLMYLLIRGDQGGHFKGIYIKRKDEKTATPIPKNAENLYHYPDLQTGGPKRRYWFEIAAISAPEPGAYSYKTAKKPKVWTLATFPVALTLLPDAPKKEYKEDDPIEFAIQAVCQTQEVADMVRKAAFVSVRLTSAADEQKTKEVVLSPVPPEEVGDPLSLVFRGSTFVRLFEKGVPEDFTARIRFAIRDEEGGQWFAGKLATFRVEPGLPKVLMVEPSQAVFGNKWVEEGILSVSVSATTEISGTVQVTVSTAAKGITVEPASTSLSPGSPVAFTFTVDPGRKMPPGGPFLETVTMKGVGSDGRSVEITIPVIVGVYAFEGPEAVRPPTAPPGFQISHTFEVKITPAVTQLEIVAENVTGPGGEIPVLLRFEEIEAPPEEGGGEKAGGSESPGDEGMEGPGDEKGEGEEERSEEEAAGEGEEGGEGVEGEAPPVPSVFKVRIDIPTDKSLAEGLYTGTITITGPGEPPLVRELPLEVEMTIPVPEMKVEPEKIVLEPESEGWMELDVEISLASSYPCDFTMTAEDLFLRETGETRGVISRTFDIRLVPQDGWGGDRLEFDKTYRVRYRVYISPNLGPGLYRGGLLMELSGAAKSAKIRLPVELTVK